MSSRRRVPIFDGHNDVLLRLWRRGAPNAVKAFLEGETKGHLDFPKARQGGFAGGLFAIFVPSTDRVPSAYRSHAAKEAKTGSGENESGAIAPLGITWHKGLCLR
jgi:membrane dipeptidase